MPNRRKFFGFLASGMVAVAAVTKLGQVSLKLVDDPLQHRWVSMWKVTNDNIGSFFLGDYSVCECDSPEGSGWGEEVAAGSIVVTNYPQKYTSLLQGDALNV
jgi:hypothetical protein